MNLRSAELATPKRKEAIVRQVAGEFIIYDKPTEHAHCLNQTAWDVWQLCDGKTTVTAMIQQFGPGSDEPVWLSLERLEKAGLLEKASGITEATTSLGRRNAVKKLGIAAAMAFPVIVSIAVPTPAQAQS